MPLPAARIALPHVDCAREPGSGRHACADEEIGGLLRRREPEHRPLGHVVLPALQWGDLRSLYTSAATPSTTRPADGRRTRQRRVPPRPSDQAPVAQAPTPSELLLPASVQPAAIDDRTGLEAHPAAGHTQPPLPDAPRRPRGRHRMLSALAATERDAPASMLHHLRRCV